MTSTNQFACDRSACYGRKLSGACAGFPMQSYCGTREGWRNESPRSRDLRLLGRPAAQLLSDLPIKLVEDA